MNEQKEPLPEAAAEMREPRTRVRAIHVIFILIAVAATLGLAYWQWTRFQSGSGTFQNLGYAFQWPVFGAFIVFAYRKYIKMEQELEVTGEAPVERELRERRERGEITEIPEEFLPKRGWANDDQAASRRQVKNKEDNND